MRSEPVARTVTGLVYQPVALSVPAVTDNCADGYIVVSLIVTVLVAVPPALVAVQESTVSAVAVEMTVWPQPAVELIGDSASCTTQLTVTGPVYQPSGPCGPP